MCHAPSLELSDHMLIASFSHASCSRHLGSKAVAGRMGPLKTLTSKKASCFLSPQKPCALMSTLALSCLFGVCSARVSPERAAVQAQSPRWRIPQSAALLRDP